MEGAVVGVQVASEVIVTVVDPLIEIVDAVIEIARRHHLEDRNVESRLRDGASAGLLATRKLSPDNGCKLHSVRATDIKAYPLYRRERSPVLTPEERDARTVVCMQLAARIKSRDLEEFFSSVGKVCLHPRSDLVGTIHRYSHVGLPVFEFVSAR